MIQAATVVPDEETRKCCCAILSALSQTKETRLPMRDLGAIPVFLALSRMDDTATRRRCAMALCNMSDEVRLRRELVAKGVMDVLADLSNSYSEETQQDCAKCLCNLSCTRGLQAPMIAQGGVEIVTIVAMVRAVSVATKRSCAIALLNLLSDGEPPEAGAPARQARQRAARCSATTVMEAVLGYGAVDMLASLAALEDDATLRVVAELYAIFSADALGRTKLTERKPTMLGLYSLMRAPDRRTQLAAGKAVGNLLLFDASCVPAAACGAVQVVKVLATLRHARSEQTCAHALTFLAKEAANRAVVVRQEAAPALVLLSQSDTAETAIAAVRAMGALAFWPPLRAPLVAHGCVPALVALALNGKHMSHILADCARTLMYLSMSEPDRPMMIEERAVTAALVLVRRARQRAEAAAKEHGEASKEAKAARAAENQVDMFSAHTIQTFSWCPEMLKKVVNDGGVHILRLDRGRGTAGGAVGSARQGGRGDAQRARADADGRSEQAQPAAEAAAEASEVGEAGWRARRGGEPTAPTARPRRRRPPSSASRRVRTRRTSSTRV